MLLKTLVFTFVALQAVAQPGWLWFPPQPQPGSFPFPQPQPYPQPGPQPSSWPFPHPHPGPYPQPMPFPMPGPYPRPGPYPQPQPIPFPFPGPQPFPEPGSFPPGTESFPFPSGTGFPGPFPGPKPFPGPFPGPEPFPPRTGSLPEPEAFPGPQLKPDPRRNPQPMPSPKDPASPCNNNVEYFCQRLDKEVSRELRAKGFKEEFNAAKAAAFTGYKPDEITQELHKLLIGESSQQRTDECLAELNNGHKVGGSFAKGRLAALGVSTFDVTVSKDSMTIDIRHHIAEYTLSVPVPSMKFEIDVIKKKFADCSTNIQEFVKGYFEIVDFEERFRSEDLQVVYDEILEWKLQSKASIIGKFDMEIDLPTWTPFETHNSAKMVEELSRSMFTGAYVNLLVAKAFHKKNQTQFIHDPERVARLKKMAQTILDEAKLQIDETEWISEESKKKLKNMHTVDDFLFGPPKTFLDAEMVDKALKIFKQFFKKAKANEGEMMAEFGFGIDCKLVFYGTVFHAADAAVKLYHGVDFEQYHHGALEANSYFAENAFNSMDTGKLIFGMPMIYGYDWAFADSKSLPFVYGTVGMVMGHELFHSFGLDRINAEGVYDVLDSNTYETAKKCYADHYFGFEMSPGNGPKYNWKDNEGFADIQAMRILVKIVTKMAGGNATEDGKEMSEEVKNNLLGLFLGYADSSCDGYEEEAWDPKREHFAMTKTNHPRNKIRNAAVMRQLPEFTQVFECKKGQPNFLSDDVCEAFPKKAASGEDTSEWRS